MRQKCSRMRRLAKRTPSALYDDASKLRFATPLEVAAEPCRACEARPRALRNGKGHRSSRRGCDTRVPKTKSRCGASTQAMCKHSLARSRVVCVQKPSPSMLLSSLPEASFPHRGSRNRTVNTVRFAQPATEKPNTLTIIKSIKRRGEESQQPLVALAKAHPCATLCVLPMRRREGWIPALRVAWAAYSSEPFPFP